MINHCKISFTIHIFSQFLF